MTEQEQDKDIKKLFEGFNPDVSDSDRFLRKLETRMDGVEFIRESSRKTLRNYRQAIVAAAVAGVACGVLMAVVFPRLVALASSFPRLADYSTLVAWVLATAITCVASFAAYTRTLRS